MPLIKDGEVFQAEAVPSANGLSNYMRIMDDDNNNHLLQDLLR